MNPPTPAPALGAPHELAIPWRRWTAFFSLPLSALLGFSSGASLIWLPPLLPKGPMTAVAAATSLLFLALAASIGRQAWKTLTDRDAVLILDADGIIDRFHSRAFIPWSDIESASLDHGDGHHLVIRLRPGAALPGGGTAERTLLQGAKRLLNGGDLAIPIGNLAYHPTKLRDALRWHLAKSRGASGRGRSQP